MSTHLYIIRHGETDWNKLRRFQGQIDIPLNITGQYQANRLKNWFDNHQIDRVYSSDLQRALFTAQSVAEKFQLQVTTLQSLRERCYGRIEGKYTQEVHLNYSDEIQDWLELEEYGIEPLRALEKRITSQVKEIVQSNSKKRIVMVSHGGTINAFLSVITHGQYGMRKSKILNTGVTHLETDGENWRIIKFNDVSHLSDMENHEVV